MYYYNKKNGFTLVELLGVIVIIGILSAMAITGVTRLIDKTKNVSDDTLKDTARMAAESYMQANKDEMPKSIGETTDLKIKTLIDSNYIKEFKNSKKQDCTDNSYVKVYKQSKNKYVYTPYIYCGDSQTITNYGPSVKISVKDNTKKFVIVINKDKGYNLNGYSFTLSTITKDSSNNNVTTEVYNSGSIQINNKKNFSKEYDISNYIDVTTANAIKIDALAYNDVGERATDSITVSYTDKTPPTCTIESYPPIGDNQWIGKDDYKNGIKRKVVAKCSDAESGCKRATFTSTWPKKDAKSLTIATISVYDNAGNKRICDTDINVDIVSPTATLKAKSGNTIVTKKDHVVNDKTPSDSDTIKVDDYKNLSSNWMNKTNYPNGVTYEVTATDDFLDSWTWEVNAPGQSNVDEKAISSTNADGKTGNFTNSKTINVGFTGEGKRYGVLTIKDKAGNKVTYKIYANIDKTDPTVNIDNIKSTKANYNSTNVNVKISTSDNNKYMNDKDLKICISNINSECSDSNYIKYNESGEYNHTLSGGYDGKYRTVYVWVKDLAGNKAKITSKYRVSSTLTINYYDRNRLLRSEKGYDFDSVLYDSKSGKAHDLNIAGLRNPSNRDNWEISNNNYFLTDYWLVDSASENAKRVSSKNKWGSIMEFANKIGKSIDNNSQTINLYAEWWQDNKYNYNGNIQIFTADVNGTYRLYAKGAQGGSVKNHCIIAANNDKVWWKAIFLGQKGGETSGDYKMNSKESIYIVVGGAGEDLDTSTNKLCNKYNYSNKPVRTNHTAGGYNGGGSGGDGGSLGDLKYAGGCGGGGATHISITNRGLLKNYSTHQSELLIVAAGGGGASGLGLSPDTTILGGYLFGVGENGGPGCSGYSCELIGTREGHGGGGAGFSGGKATPYSLVQSSSLPGSGGTNYLNSNFLTNGSNTNPAYYNNALNSDSGFDKFKGMNGKAEIKRIEDEASLSRIIG